MIAATFTQHLTFSRPLFTTFRVNVSDVPKRVNAIHPLNQMNFTFFKKIVEHSVEFQRADEIGGRGGPMIVVRDY